MRNRANLRALVPSGPEKFPREFITVPLCHMYTKEPLCSGCSPADKDVLVVFCTWSGVQTFCDTAPLEDLLS